MDRFKDLVVLLTGAAMCGELATERGAVKITYGTSGMIDIHTADVPVLSERGAYPLVLWSMDGERPYMVEGTVITAGASPPSPRIKPGAKEARPR